ncbi:hypothetical protein DFJ63DRAFT_314377 [Scheffersomyces coipomensis]|uniref:uncharacterized protein n=1 Tax=Scheffersomyces coipomensis TaxID=1788519 RepID=UPI00315D8DBE
MFERWFWFDTDSSFYDDDYIYDFFTYELPNFDNYIKLKILKGMSIELFLILQLTTNDEFIKQIKSKDINPQPLVYPTTWNDVNEIIKFNESLTDCMDYNKQLRHSIPIEVEIENEDPIQILQLIENLLENDKSNCIELELRLYRNSSNGLREIKSLETFKYANRVSQLQFHSYEKTNIGDVLEVDFAKYINLKELHGFSKQILMKLPQSSIQNLTELSLENIHDPSYLVKLDNLKSLAMELDYDPEFDIKYLPRNITILDLTCENTIININSEYDWPQNLKHLSLIGGSSDRVPFEKLKHYKLPPKLKTLSADLYGDLKMFSRLPDSMIDLFIGITNFRNENILTIPRWLRNLNISEWNSSSSTDNIEFKSALERLELNGIPFVIPHLNFENLKHSLRRLTISSYQHQISLYHLNFNQFTKLTYINIVNSNFESLDNFKPPPTLKFIQILVCNITSITHQCPLFNSPFDFPELHDIIISQCHINFISPNIQLPINLKNLDIDDKIIKHFSLTNSIIYHPALESLRIGVIPFSKVVPDDLLPLNIYFKSKFKSFTIKYISCAQVEFDQFYRALEYIYGRKIISKDPTNDGGIILKFAD